MDFTSQDPAVAYTALRQTHRQAAALEARRRGRVLWALAGTMLLLLLLSFGPVRQALAVPGAGFGYAVVAVLLALFVFLVTRYLKAQFAIDNRQRLLTMYDTAMARVDGTETQSGQTGPPLPAGHLYGRDLDLLGHDSLFGLLDTARTTVGEQGLARYLLHGVPQLESVARQQAVRELAPQHSLREQLTLLGATNLHRISATLVDDWLAAPVPVFATYLRPALIATAALATALLLHPAWFGLHPWSAVLPYLGLVLALQGLLCYRVRAEAGPLLTTSMRLQGSMRLFAEGLALMDSLTFTCPKLQKLQAAAREPAGAVAELKRLQSMMSVAEQRGQPYFLPLSLLTAAGTQTAISLARWKAEHVPAMRRWLDAWGEFEALNALATFAFEHPDYCWPELLPEGAAPRFEARDLRHPLLKEAVANDVALTGDARFYLISGSNMSGKSTLLRAMGVNAVLAYAGAPAAAHSLALTPLTLGASLALTDSLAEGKSRFLAEVERLSGIVAASKVAPVLFLVDEIFSGTNSSDRRTAAGAVLHALLQHGALGALSTHDLALTDLATEANTGVNLHMASPDADDPLAFDYRLKPGANKSSNALAVVRMMGLEV